MITVYCLWDNSGLAPELAGVFTTPQKARDWLKAQENGSWTPGEISMASIEAWPVDAE